MCSLLISISAVGFEIQIGPDSFIRAHGRAIKEEVSRKAEANVAMLEHFAGECEDKGVIYALLDSSSCNVMRLVHEQNCPWFT